MWVRTYTPEGWPERVDWYLARDGGAVEWLGYEAWSYDGLGRVATFRSACCTGSDDDWSVTYEYDDLDRIVLSYGTSGESTYHYDGASRLVETDRDEDVDGTIDDTYQRAYEGAWPWPARVVNTYDGEVFERWWSTYDCTAG